MSTQFIHLFIHPLSETFFQKALIGGGVIAIVCSVMGCLVILRRMAFLGDALSHAMIAGVAGGYLFIQVPQIDSVLARLLKERWSMLSLDHVNYFSKKTMTRLLSQHGFVVKRMKSSIELKYILLYVVLPFLKRKQKRKEEWTVSERQRAFNRLTNRPAQNKVTAAAYPAPAVNRAPAQVVVAPGLRLHRHAGKNKNGKNTYQPDGKNFPFHHLLLISPHINVPNEVRTYLS